MNRLFNLHLLKFGLVGITGMVIDFGLTYACKEKLKWNKYLSNSIGFSLAVINNFFLNKYWTFENSKAAQLPLQFSYFLLIALIGLALNNFFLFLFHKKIQIQFYGSKLIAIGLVFLWNYFANAHFTFATK